MHAEKWQKKINFTFRAWQCKIYLEMSTFPPLTAVYTATFPPQPPLRRNFHASFGFFVASLVLILYGGDLSHRTESAYRSE